MRRQYAVCVFCCFALFYCVYLALFLFIFFFACLIIGHLRLYLPWFWIPLGFMQIFCLHVKAEIFWFFFFVCSTSSSFYFFFFFLFPLSLLFFLIFFYLLPLLFFFLFFLSSSLSLTSFIIILPRYGALADSTAVVYYPGMS